MQTSDLIADEERMALNAHKHDLAKSALLVIDMQKGFASKEVEEITDNILSLIKEYRAKGLPVFFTQHGHYPGDKGWLCRREGPPGEGTILIFSEEFDLIPPIQAVAGKYERVNKSTYSAFEDTDLAKRLSYFDTETVVVVGTMTDYCVENTARSAIAHNFDLVVVKDAVASYMQKQAENTLHNLRSYGAILSCEEVTAELAEVKARKDL